MDLGTAVGAIQIVYDGSGVSQAKSDLGTLGDTAAQNAVKLGIAGAAIGTAGAKVTEFMADSVGIAADVQAGLLSIQAATGATDEQLASLDDTIGTLGKDTVFTAQDITQAADTMAKAGIGVEDQVGGALKTVTDLAAATGESMDASAGSVADAMAIFRLSGDDVTQVADLTTQAVNASKIGLDEYNAGFRNLAPTMAQFSHNQAEATDLLGQTGQAIAFFTANGLKGADAGLSFARMIQNLATPSTQEFADAIEAAGINMFDADGKFVGTAAAIEQVNKAFEGLTDQERVDLLDKLGVGQEAADVVGIIAAVGDEYGGFVDDMEDGNTAAESAAIRMQGLNGAIESLGGSISEAQRQMGNALLAPLEAVVRAVTAVVNAFLGLPQPVIAAIAVFTGLIGIAATIAGGLIAMAAAAAFLGPALAGAAIAGVPLLAILGAVAAAAAVAAVAFGLYQGNVLGFKDAVDGALSDVQKKLNTFSSRFNSSFSAREAQGINKVSAAIGAFGDALRVATGINILPITEGIADGLATLVDGFNEAITNGMNPFTAAAFGVAGVIDQMGFHELAGQVLEAGEAFQRFGNTFESSFQGGKDQGLAGAAAAITAFGVALSDMLGVDVTGPFDAISGAVDALAQGLGNAKDVAIAAVEGIANALKEGLGNALSFLTSNILPGAVSALGNFLGTIKDVGTALLQGDFSQAGQILGDAFSNLGDFVGNTAQAIGDAFANIDFDTLGADLGAKLGGAIEGASSFIGDAFSALGSKLSELAGQIDGDAIFSAIATTITAAADRIGPLLATLPASIANAIRDALTGIDQFLGGLDFGSIVTLVAQKLTEAFAAAKGGLETIGASVGSALVNALNTIGTFLGGLDVQSIVQGVSDALLSAFNTGGDWLSTVAATVGSQLATALNTIGDFIGGFNPLAIFEDVAAKIREAITVINFDDIGSTIATLLGNALNTIQDHLPTIDLSGVVEKIQSALTSALSALSGGGADGGGSFRGGGGGIASIAQGIGTAIESAFNTLSFDLSGMGEALKGALEAACGLDLTSVFDAIGTAVGTATTAFANFQGIVQPVLEAFVAKVQELGTLDISGVFDAMKAALDAATSAFSNFQGIVKPVLDAFVSKLGELKTLDVSGIIDPIATAFSGIGSAFANFQTLVNDPLTALKDALTNFPEMPATLDGLAAAIDAIGAAAGTALDNVTKFFAALGGGIDAANQDPAANDPALSWLSRMEESAGGASDQAAAASEMVGDFATNFVAQVAESFAQVDWSPVRAAIDTGLQSIFSGGGGSATAAGPGPGGTGGGGEGIGTALATSLIQQISAAFTPEAFAPIKAAFDSAMSAAMAVTGGGEGGQTGGGDLIAANLMNSIALALPSKAATITSALQAVLTTAGNAIKGLEALGAQIMTQIAAGIGPATQTVTAAVTAAVSAAIAAASAAAAGANATGVAFMTAIGQGVGANTGTFTAAVQAAVSAAIAAGSAAAAAANAIGNALIVAAGQGVGAGAGTFSSAVQAMVTTAIAAGVQAAAGASAIGAAVSEGAASGVILTAMNSAVETMVNNGIAAGMAAAEAASPSQVARRELGQPIGEGAAMGVDDTAPMMTDSVTSMMTDAMSAGEDALAMAKDLFSQYGLEFGNELAGQTEAGITAGIPGAADKAKSLYDQIIQNVQDRIGQMKESQKSWLPVAQDIVDERNSWAAGLMRNQDMTFNFNANLDGEKMAQWTQSVTLEPMLGMKDRGSRKRGFRAGA